MCYRHIFRKKMLCRHYEICLQRQVKCPIVPCPLGGFVDDDLGVLGEETVPCSKCISERKYIKNAQGQWVVSIQKPYVVAGIAIA